MKRSTVPILICLFAPPSEGTEIFKESFEEVPGATYTLSNQFDDGSFDYFGRYAVPSNNGSARDEFQSGWDGSFGIHGQDFSGEGFDATQTVAIDGIDISSFDGLSVTLALGARANESFGFENFEVADNDGVEIYATIDGGPRQWIGSFAPPQEGTVSGGPTGDLYLDADFDQFGEGELLTDSLDDFTFPIAGTGTSLTLEIELTTSGSFETVALDNVRVAGNPTGGTSPFEAWIATFPTLVDPVDQTKTANPDDDSLSNFSEFALDGDPTTGKSTGKYVVKVAPVDGAATLTLTFPMREGAVAGASDPPGGELVLEQVADGIRYAVQAGDALTSFELDVSEVSGADAADAQVGLPALNSGWIYCTFRSPGLVADEPAEFMRVRIEAIEP